MSLFWLRRPHVPLFWLLLAAVAFYPAVEDSPPGRLLLNLFVWQAECPLTTPFAKLFTRDAFDRRDIAVLAATAALGAIALIISALFQAPAAELIAVVLLLFVGLGVLRRAVIHVFPDLPYAQIFIVGAIVFAVLFPLTAYALEAAE